MLCKTFSGLNLICQADRWHTFSRLSHSVGDPDPDVSGPPGQDPDPDPDSLPVVRYRSRSGSGSFPFSEIMLAKKGQKF